MGPTPSTIAVSWRQATATLVAVACCLAALVVVVRADGLPAVDAASSQATRWFLHDESDRVVLVDGFGGRALASLDTGAVGNDLLVAEGAGAAYLLNDTTGEARAIDTAELRLGSATVVGALGSGRALARAAAPGLLIADPGAGVATLLPLGAEAVEISFEVDDGAPSSQRVALAPDGAVWSLADGTLHRSTSAGISPTELDVGGAASRAALSLVGNRPLVLDREGRRARLGDGDWIDLPTDADGSEIVLQEQGPDDDCGWLGTGDDLWCIDEEGIVERSTVPDLGIDGGSLLAIAGDAAALVRRGPTEVVQFDWRNERLVDDRAVTVDGDAALEVTATVDVIWIDDTRGDTLWTVHPWGIQTIDKDADALLVLGDEGEVLDEPDANTLGEVVAEQAVEPTDEERSPDDNGRDDPPVAVDDQVTARTGNPVSVAVTANDYDPDGEAIAVVAVRPPTHGTAVVGSATTVVYTPDPGYVGLDRFVYAISDGAGTQATAEVVVELLAPDSTNRPPVGVEDSAQTGPGVPVVVEVLLNDVDPERDALAIETFSPPGNAGEVRVVKGPSGLPALRFEPTDGFEGTATFTYRPADVFAAVGDDVVVRVDVARPGAANRAPTARPDALRVRRDRYVELPVLVNDSDPEGDRLTITEVDSLPDGLEVRLRGEQLGIVARTGSAERLPFRYRIDDGKGNVAVGSVLVVVIDDDEPNRPPIASPDIETAVVGQTILIDVTANDTDPDNDPLTVIDVSQPDGQATVAIGRGNRVEFTATVIDADESANRRFTYTVTDGRGHEVVGEVTVNVLAQPLPDPPYAQDDSTFTFVNEPVTIDVLRNDGDPSGERPTLVGPPSCPGPGFATLTADDQVRYTPPRDADGSFRCTYEVANSQGGRATAAIIVSVRRPDIVNEPPRAGRDEASVEIDDTIWIDVLDNDVDPDGDDDQLRVTSSTRPDVGEAERVGDRIRYRAGPTPGRTSIEYQVEDPDGGIATGVVLITITEIANRPPVARPDRRTIPGRDGVAVIDLLANDSDPDGAAGQLRVTEAALDASSRAAFRRSGPTVTITPEPDFVGVLSGTYTIADGEGLTDTSTFTVEVTDPPNRPPEAIDDAVTVEHGGVVTVPVLFNDAEPDGDELTLTITSRPDPALGSVTLNADQTITFTAEPGGAGTATIGYEITDGELADRAAVRVEVLPCGRSAPIAPDAFLETGYRQPIAVDLDAYAQNGTVTDVVAPAGYQDGVYTPPAGFNDNVTIGYAVVNECEQRATGTITIDVNQRPIGQDQSITLGRNEVREIVVGQMASDDESLTVYGSSGAPGWVTTDADRLVIAPGQDVPDGTYAWQTTVGDPGGLTTTITVAATIANVPPSARADTIDVSTGEPRTADLVANDVDPDGDDGALRIQSVPSSIRFANGETGAVSLTSDGRGVLVDPRAGRGAASFTYSVVDASGAVSAPAEVAVTGPAPNRPPTASDQSARVTARVTTEITLSARDPDGDAVRIGSIDDPAGVVVGRPGGLTVEIRTESPGSYSFTFDVVDAFGARSTTATVTVDATPPATTVPTTAAPTTTAPPTTTIPPTTTTTTPTTTTPPTTTTTTPPTTTTTTPPTTTTTTPPTTTTTEPTRPSPPRRPSPPTTDG